MTQIDLLLRAAAYFIGCYSLCLLSWVLAGRFLPKGERPGLRLAVVLVGQFVLTAIVVQTLGLAGVLNREFYFVTTLLIGIAVSWHSRLDHPHRSMLGLSLRLARLWVTRTPNGLGYASAVTLLILSWHGSVVIGYDSMSNHGPLIVGWIQEGAISLTSYYNYPQCWEYQFVPNFLFMGSDVLLIVPRLAAAVVLLLLLRELGARLRLPGGQACLVAWLCLLSPLIWGVIHGHGALKNDLASGLGLLMLVVAIERAWRARRGAVWLFQLGAFMVSGAKGTGFVYSGLAFILLFLLLARHQPRPSARKLIGVIGAFVALQAIPLASQVANIFENGNPIYPIKVCIGEEELLPGFIDVRGTSIRDHAHELETWRLFLVGSSLRVGAEVPLILLVFVVATVWTGTRRLLQLVKRRIVSRGETFFLGVCFATCLLWVLYFASPWSRGHTAPRFDFLAGGLTLRYAMAPLFLSYLLAATYLDRRLGRARSLLLWSMLLPLLISHKWRSTIVLLSAGNGWVNFVFGFSALLLGFVAVWWASSKIWGRFATTARRRTLFATTVAIGIFLAIAPFTRMVDGLRERACRPAHREIRSFVWNKIPPGSTIAMNQSRPDFRYLLFGPRLNNRLLWVPTKFAPPGKINIPATVRYFYFLPDKKANKAEALRVIESRGWRAVARKKAGILFHRDDAGPPRGSE